MEGQLLRRVRRSGSGINSDQGIRDQKKAVRQHQHESGGVSTGAPRRWSPDEAAREPVVRRSFRPDRRSPSGTPQRPRGTRACCSTHQWHVPRRRRRRGFDQGPPARRRREVRRTIDQPLRWTLSTRSRCVTRRGALRPPAAGRWSDWLATGIAATTLGSYALVYTPLKRVASAGDHHQRVPGALPPMIGWAASRGSLSLEAWVLFAIVFFWQMPHVLAISWMYREDYERGGVRVLPVGIPTAAARRSRWSTTRRH